MRQGEAREAECRRAADLRIMEEQRLAREDHLVQEDQAEMLCWEIPRMEPNTDVEDFLELFKEQAAERKLDKNKWISHLQPVLNDRCRSAFMALPTTDYDRVKDHLIQQCGI